MMRRRLTALQAEAEANEKVFSLFQLNVFTRFDREREKEKEKARQSNT